MTHGNYKIAPAFYVLNFLEKYESPDRLEKIILCNRQTNSYPNTHPTQPFKISRFHHKNCVLRKFLRSLSPDGPEVAQLFGIRCGAKSTSAEHHIFKALSSIRRRNFRKERMLSKYCHQKFKGWFF